MLQIHTFPFIGLVLFALLHVWYSESTRTDFATVMTCGFLLPAVFSTELMTSLMSYIDTRQNPLVVIAVDIAMIILCYYMTKRYCRRFTDMVFPSIFSIQLFLRFTLFIPLVFVAGIGLFFHDKQFGQALYLITGISASICFSELFVYMLRFYEKNLQVSE